MFCAPTVCCVQPKAYKMVKVLFGTAVDATNSANSKKAFCFVPQIRSTISGV